MRGLYRDKKGIVIAFKPILHSNYMPQVDSDDSAARNRLWVARFGSTFPADLAEPDVHRRRFPRIENLRETMEQWAPYHFLLMLEALRDFRRRNCVLPVGAQQRGGARVALQPSPICCELVERTLPQLSGDHVDGVAALGELDGRLEQLRERPCTKELSRIHPRGCRARHGYAVR